MARGLPKWLDTRNIVHVTHPLYPNEPLCQAPVVEGFGRTSNTMGAHSCTRCLKMVEVIQGHRKPRLLTGHRVRPDYGKSTQT